MGDVVDIHCHNFNGDDLPVRGFVSGVHFDGRPLGAPVATLVARMVQAKAPGYDEELRRLDALLALAPSPAQRADLGDEALPTAVPKVDEGMVPDLDATVEAELRELAASDPYLLEDASAAMAEIAGDSLQATESIGSWGPAAVRAVRWAALYASSRLDNTVHLSRQFPDVDLFTPMLVDLEFGLNDRAKTTVLQQVVLQERISRLSMLGLLPGRPSVRVHPLVGFDPRRQVLSLRKGDPFTALDTVKLAVERYGFVGVKLYPPMGFRPLNNATKPGGPPGQDGALVDAALRELYSWCRDEDVPVTAHCNISNGARDAYNGFSDPADWGTVLEEFPGLHLNLGHFGGMRKIAQDAWSRQIARLARDGDAAPGRNLYADVGNHRTDKTEFPAYIRELGELFGAEETRVMGDRLMYGSDWYMLAILPNLDDFQRAYRDAYESEFGVDAVQQFMGERALSFLGFRTAGNKNRARLVARYEHYAPGALPSWLTEA